MVVASQVLRQNVNSTLPAERKQKQRYVRTVDAVIVSIVYKISSRASTGAASGSSTAQRIEPDHHYSDALNSARAWPDLDYAGLEVTQLLPH